MAFLNFVILFAVALTVIPSVQAVSVPFYDGYGAMYVTKESADESSAAKALAYAYMRKPFIDFSDNCRVNQVAFNNGCKNIGCINYKCTGYAHRVCARGWHPKAGTNNCVVLFSKTAGNGLASPQRVTFKFEDASSGSCTYICFSKEDKKIASLTGKLNDLVEPTPVVD